MSWLDVPKQFADHLTTLELACSTPWCNVLWIVGQYMIYPITLFECINGTYPVQAELQNGALVDAITAIF